MMTAFETWCQVVITFLKLSLFSIGSGNTLLQAYHQDAVDRFGWLTTRQFSDLYGLAEACPGPSSMLVGLLGLGAGWKHGPFWAILTGLKPAIRAEGMLSRVLLEFSARKMQKASSAPMLNAARRPENHQGAC